ncbi:choice-of-anchor H family protein [Shewanella dokdonensis]|uniref:Choice-of-anchor H family protein n=1 Tax=Shewanella dokdonensis TaxID=712036 RepID=A0ABX8DEE2_9GAMM|nr:choice-of-anchor H family protein [Shewanella dokdonensis]MCL1073690.1 choice-of-anchor H family protein [Shewanella dokdonensis]QVK22581.1 choice-of-anchor H family protein [Shewanella dokdonensis]
MNKLSFITFGAVILLWNSHSFAATTRSVDYQMPQATDELQLRQQASERLQRADILTLPVKTRDQVIATKAATVTGSKAVQNVSSFAAHSYYHQFSFYDVATYLLDDDNYDGFFHSFSLDIDADVYGAEPTESVPVYAEIYLSRNGGDWLHLYTTDVFYLQGNSSYDSYQVSTALETGYPSDHYDVLIDLYEVGYSDIVATISSDELNSLYALPLQSRDRDNYDNGGAIVTVSAGSLSMFGVLALAMLAWRRR